MTTENCGMPRVCFLGTGEAFDGERTHCSVLYEGSRRILFDCGPTVPSALWRRRPHADELDAVYVSHFHGDHLFGVPFLLTRMRTDGRTKPLVFLGQRGLRDRVRELTNLAYGSTWDEAGFEIDVREVEPGAPVSWEGFAFANAESEHPWRNLSVRMEGDGRVFCYSGDGAATPDSKALFAGADLLVHEAYVAEEPVPGHGTVRDVVALAKKAAVRRLALVHLARDFRPDVHRALQDFPTGGFELRVPEDGEEWLLV